VKVVIPKIMMHPRENAGGCYADRRRIATPVIIPKLRWLDYRERSAPSSF
jgi:hypothetical protein